MSDIKYAALVVNWMTQDRTIRAIKSLRNFYPDIHVFIVDDGTPASNYGDFMEFYKADEYRPEVIFDPDLDRLKNVENSTFIGLAHHISHGAAIDYAIPMMRDYEWILHFDSDVRLTSPGLIEYALEGLGDDFCQVGNEKIQEHGYAHIANFCMMFRPNLAYMYSASFKPIYIDRLEAGHRYVTTLEDNGFKIKYKDLSQFYVHLRWGNEEQKKLWKLFY